MKISEIRGELAKYFKGDHHAALLRGNANGNAE